MYFSILGALEVTHEERVCTPTARKVRWVLALLLTRANHIVSMDSIIDELWADDSPRSAVTTAQTYIYQLRKTFDRAAGQQAGSELLHTCAPGYRLNLSPGQLDSEIFESLVDIGREHLDAGRYQEASQTLRQALSMWRGPALANIVPGRLLEAHVAHLTEARMRAIEMRIHAERELGQHREMIPELRRLVAENPLNEWLHARLIEALHLAGRRADALYAYQQVRRTLSAELGLEPSLDLQRVQRQVLAAGAPAIAA